MAAEVAAALAFIFVGESGQTDLDLPLDRRTDSERKRVKPRGLQVEGAGGTGMFLAEFGGGDLTARDSLAEMGVLGSWRKTEV